MTTPYTYFITHLPSSAIYHGVRYAKGCDPKDLWVSYFTSSSAVKRLIEIDGSDAFKVEVRRIFDYAEEAKLWEARVNRRIIGRLGVLNECSWPAVSQEAMIRSKVSRAIVGSDGLTPAQRGGCNWKIKKYQVDPKSGLTFNDLRTLRRLEYLNNGGREAMSARSKKWHSENENPSKRADVRSKISTALKEGIAAGRIKTTKGMKIPKISKALKGNTAVKGYKWYNDGKTDSRLHPSDERIIDLQAGRINVKVKGWSYQQLICPHCQHTGGGGNMKRYHFDACKSK